MIDQKRKLRALAFHSGLPLWKIRYRRIMGQQKIFILMYHRIDYQAPPFFEIAINPLTFEKQVLFLRKHFNIVDLNDIDKLAFSKSSKKDTVVLTFDDGYQDNYAYAFPVLKKYRVPATIFLATNFVNTHRLLWYDKLAWILYNSGWIPDMAKLSKHDFAPEIMEKIEHFFMSSCCIRSEILRSIAKKLKPVPIKAREKILNMLAKACKIQKWPNTTERAMLSWEEVREMSVNGVSFGSHTASHPILSSISISEAKREILKSKKMIEDQIQKPVASFAYPYGGKEDFTDEVKKILIDAEFNYACTTISGPEQFPLNSPLTLKRRGVPESPYLFY